MAATNSSAWLRRISPSLRPVERHARIRSHTSSGKCAANFTTPLRIIYDHELILYHNCTCSIEFEDRALVCEPDTFIIIPPGVWHSELCLRTRKGRRYWCHFDWQFLG